MEFGSTYIFLFGFKIFEPTVILTNLIIFIVCIYYYLQLKKSQYIYSKQTALFVLFMAISSCFGSTGHAIQHQMGIVFFKSILFFSHSLTFASIYFCFRAAYTLYIANQPDNKIIITTVLISLCVIVIFSTLTANFILVKIPAGAVLIFSLVIHFLSFKKNIPGAGQVVFGILISFLSIVVHSFKISFSEWFNHKDIAHLIIAASLIFICEGAKKITNNETALRI